MTLDGCFGVKKSQFWYYYIFKAKLISLQLQSSNNLTRNGNSCVPTDVTLKKSSHIALSEIGKSRG